MASKLSTLIIAALIPIGVAAQAPATDSYIPSHITGKISPLWQNMK